MVELIEWLVRNPDAGDRIEAVAKKISNEVVAALDHSVDTAKRAERRKKLAASHFWCDILAGIAKTLNDIQEEIDKVIAQVPKLVISAINTSSTIGTATVELAVEKTWEQIKELDFVKTALQLHDLSEPVRAVRMLAIMICPAPERHEAVIKHCVKPLVGDQVHSLTKQRLETALPAAWLD
ncbi:hypothetical protein [Umezawaea tangerina]|uniref:hypothetical protein n=1 Tax=Umezawaea tangerina TaxID=84725 RepID=UPI0011B1EECE|nr:hypothetical protein [Umezawaea tangerina]